MRYDPRLDSDDVITRQQAEIEALRTALVASNSESSGALERLRLELADAKASYEGQLRNTHAFQSERDAALRSNAELRGALERIGERAQTGPSWDDGYLTQSSRHIIRNLCDAALASSSTGGSEK